MLNWLWDTWVWSVGHEDSQNGKATNSSTLAWRIPWIVEPGRLHSMGPQRVRPDWALSSIIIPILQRRKWTWHSIIDLTQVIYSMDNAFHFFLPFIYFKSKSNVLKSSPQAVFTTINFVAIRFRVTLLYIYTYTYIFIQMTKYVYILLEYDCFIMC